MQLNLTLKPATANNSWKDDSESGERRNLLNRAFVDGASMLFYDDDSTKLAEWKHSDWCSRSGGAMNRWTNMLRWVAHPNLDVELKSLAIPQKSWTGWQRLHRQLLCCRFSVIYIGPSLSLSPPALSGVGLPSSATNFSHPMHFVGSTQRNLFPIFLQLDPNPT